MELSEIMLRAFAEAVPQKTKSETEFLASIEDKDERREFFLCLIYRMPLEDLQRLKAQGIISIDAEEVSKETFEDRERRAAVFSFDSFIPMLLYRMIFR